MSSRTVNWLEHTSHVLSSFLTETGDFPESSLNPELLVERLSCLLLQRLPQEVGQEILDLLPSDPEGYQLRMLRESIRPGNDASIGYLSFIEKVEITLGCKEIDPSPDGGYRQPTLISKIADRFLWAFAREFPAELKSKLESCLPSELRHRMDLRCAVSDESMVA